MIGYTFCKFDVADRDANEFETAMVGQPHPTLPGFAVAYVCRVARVVRFGFVRFVVKYERGREVWAR